MYFSEVGKGIFRNKKKGSMRKISFPIAIILIGILVVIRILFTIIVGICYKIQKSLFNLLFKRKWSNSLESYNVTFMKILIINCNGFAILIISINFGKFSIIDNLRDSILI